MRFFSETRPVTVILFLFLFCFVLFFCISDTSKLSSHSAKIKKEMHRQENFRANILDNDLLLTEQEVCMGES